MVRLLSLISVVLPCLAQTSTYITTFYPFPTGVEDSRTSWQDTVPLPCAEGCQLILPSYLVCYVFTTTDQFGIPYDEFNQTACDEYLCMQERYDLLTACLECIISNGNERPEGYTFNTSLTEVPAGPTQTEYPEALPNPNGLIDRELGEVMLRNVSEGCARAGTGLQVPTLVASPTTTGPYYTRWSSGVTRQLPVWTGLTQYTENLTALIATITYELPGGSSTSGPVRGSVGVQASQQQTGTSTAASAAATTSGAAVAGRGAPGTGMMRIFSGVIGALFLLG